MPNLQDDDLKEQMLAEAMLILDSVAFLETQIHHALGDLQEAVNNRFYDDADKIESRIRHLLKKTNDENVQMTEFMERYQKEINEKKTVLPRPQQKKQVHDGGFPAQQRRQAGCAPLQRIT